MTAGLDVEVRPAVVRWGRAASFATAAPGSQVMPVQAYRASKVATRQDTRIAPITAQLTNIDLHGFIPIAQSYARISEGCGPDEVQEELAET